MDVDEIWSDYCDYLIDLVGLKDEFRENYGELLLYLHMIPFTYKIPLDENRLKDGLRLRSGFTYDIRELDKYPCSVLEVLIAFAIRIDQEFTGDPREPHPDVIFWDMIYNLNLESCDNEHFNQEFVFVSVQKWLLRDFSPNGKDSIFPLRISSDSPDQRKVEMWTQMLCYLRDNDRYGNNRR